VGYAVGCGRKEIVQAERFGRAESGPVPPYDSDIVREVPSARSCMLHACYDRSERCIERKMFSKQAHCEAANNCVEQRMTMANTG
jgi:hypothetical protein